MILPGKFSYTHPVSEARFRPVHRFYPTPKEAASNIKNYVAFYRVSLLLNRPSSAEFMGLADQGNHSDLMSFSLQRGIGEVANFVCSHVCYSRSHVMVMILVMYVSVYSDR